MNPGKLSQAVKIQVKIEADNGKFEKWHEEEMLAQTYSDVRWGDCS